MPQQITTPNQNLPKLPRKRNWFRVCLFSCLGIFIFLILLATSAVAATGLVRIPIFSAIFYRNPPEPAREVAPDQNFDYAEELANSAELTTDPQNTKVELSEEAVTYLLTQGDGGEGEGLKDTQIAIEKDYIEIYGRVGDTPSFFTVWAKPEEISGSWMIDIKKVKIGKILVPSWLAEKLVERFAGESFDQFFTSSDVEIKDIQLEKEKLILTVDLSKSKELEEELEKIQ